MKPNRYFLKFYQFFQLDLDFTYPIPQPLRAMSGSPSPAPSVWSQLIRLCCRTGAIALLTSATFSTAAATATPDYTLFVGVVFVRQARRRGRGDTELERKRALVDNPDHAKVPPNEGIGFSWKMATKVSSVSATIADLESKRIFSPTNAPKLQTIKSYQITDAQAREFVQIDYLSEN